MRKLLITMMMLISLLAAGIAAAQEGEKLGGAISEGMIPLFSALDINANNQPALMLSDGSVIQVWAWDGSAWAQAGEGLTTEGLVNKFAVGANGEALVSYLEATESGSGALKVAFWDGTAWATLGEMINLFPDSGSFNFDESLLITAEGQPVIAWTETPDFMSPDQVYVRQWDGSTWQPLGDLESLNLNTASSADMTAITALPEGGFMVAWGEDGMVFERTWDGTAWSDAAQVGNHSDYQTDLLSLETTPAGVVLTRALWSEGIVEVSLYNNAEWLELPGLESVPALAAVGYADQISIGADAEGVIYLAWVNNTDNVAGAARWNGTAWEDVGAAVTFETLVSAPIAIAGDGTLYTARLDMLAGATGIEVFAYPAAQ